MNVNAVVAMLDASAEAGMLLDERGVVTKMNRASNELFGMPINSSGGKNGCVYLQKQQHVSYFLELPTTNDQTNNNEHRHRGTIDEEPEEEEDDDNNSVASSVDEDRYHDTQNDVYWWERVKASLDASKDGACQKYKGTAQTMKEEEFPVKVTIFPLKIGIREPPIDSNILGGVSTSEEEDEPYVYGMFVHRRIKAKTVPSRKDSICSETGSTEIKQKQEEALMRAEYMEHAVDEALDPMFIIDHHGKILLTNKAATIKFGWTYQEFQRGNISMIASGKHGRRHDDYIRRYLNTGEGRVIGKKRTLKAVKKDGTEFPIELAVTEVNQSEASGARLFCGYVHDVTEAQMLANQLEAKSEMALALINSSTEPMFQINERGKIKMVNKAASDVFGYTAEEFLGHNISMICGGEHGIRHSEYMKRYLKTGEKRAIGKKRELQARRKDGTEIPIQLEINEIRTKKSDERLFCGFLRVLSKEKAHEYELLHQSALMNGMIDSAFDPMFQINQEGIIQLVNTAAVSLFGWSKEEFVGKNISMIMPNEHGLNHNLYLTNYLQTGEKRVIGQNRTVKGRKRDGTEFPVQLGVKEVKNPNTGESYFCGFLKDLTRTVSDQERLARKEALTVGMINSAFDPMVLINCFGIIHMINQSACDVFGYAREELLGCNISILCGGEHAGKEKHNTYMQRYLQHGGKKVIGRRRVLTARRKDGSEFPIELGVSEVNTIWNERFFCGFIRDIRRQIYDEKEMKEREALNFAVIQASHDALFAIDEHWTVYLANSAACRLLNCTPNELRHKDLSDVFVDAKKMNPDDTTQYTKFQRLKHFLSRPSTSVSEGNITGNASRTYHEVMDITQLSPRKMVKHESFIDRRREKTSTMAAPAGEKSSSSTRNIYNASGITTVDVNITEVKGPFQMLLVPSTVAKRSDGTRFYAVSFRPVSANGGKGGSILGSALGYAAEHFLTAFGDWGSYLHRQQSELDNGLTVDGPKRDSHGDIIDGQQQHKDGKDGISGDGGGCPVVQHTQIYSDGGDEFSYLYTPGSVASTGTAGGGGCPFPH